MEPHSYECGNPPRPPGPCLSAGIRFNGAALLRVRKWGRGGHLVIQTDHASMEPHSYECGNMASRGGALKVRTASMEPHSYECGNCPCAPRTQGCFCRLQWSRTLTSAEIRPVHGNGPQVFPASMEPHSYECGNEEIEGDDDGGMSGFNGAALLRVRKYNQKWQDKTAYELLQWSRTLTSAEMHRVLVRRGRKYHGFNGAALLRVRKSVRSRLSASRTLPCFNGAALLRVRKSRAPEKDSAEILGFNGAALLRVRK